MLYLLTGTPGSSKTLNAIDMVTSDDNLNSRPVYYLGIRDLQLDWIELTIDQAKRWYELPDGAVIVIDEAQQVFPAMGFKKGELPKMVTEFETHRHHGWDIILITQKPTKIDKNVRELVGTHYHFRRLFGQERATRFAWNECHDDPNDRHSIHQAVKSRIKFNKKLYGAYRSAEVHTHKKRLPWFLYALPVVALVAVFLIWQAVSSFGESPKPVAVSASPIQPGQQPDRAVPDRDKPVSRDDWLELREPRVKDMPQSAPVYDAVREVRSAPRPQCMRAESTGECNCYTQQATPLDMSEQACNRIVDAGYFDPTRPDPARSEEDDTRDAPSGIDRLRRAVDIRRDMLAVQAGGRPESGTIRQMDDVKANPGGY